MELNQIIIIYQFQLREEKTGDTSLANIYFGNCQFNGVCSNKDFSETIHTKQPSSHQITAKVV